MPVSADSFFHAWTLAEIRDLHDLPLFELLDKARRVYLQHSSGKDLQLCTLLSVKTGGCPEDCGYCAQSSRHHKSPVEPQRLLDVEAVVGAARQARDQWCHALLHGRSLAQRQRRPSL